MSDDAKNMVGVSLITAILLMTAVSVSKQVETIDFCGLVLTGQSFTFIVHAIIRDVRHIRSSKGHDEPQDAASA